MRIRSATLARLTFAVPRLLHRHLRPFEDGTTPFLADPFHVIVLAPLASPFELWAGSDVSVTTEPVPEPVPEPTSALLVGLGIAALGRSARRFRYT